LNCRKGKREKGVKTLTPKAAGGWSATSPSVKRKKNGEEKRPKRER